jgi:hypothetical protein
MHTEILSVVTPETYTMKEDIIKVDVRGHT